MCSNFFLVFFLGGVKQGHVAVLGDFFPKFQRVDAARSNYRGTTLFCLRLSGAAAEEILIRKACMQEQTLSLPYCRTTGGP